MQLRPFQAEALSNIENRLRCGVNRQVVSMATGTGKTPLLASVPKLIDPTKRWMVLVHREELAQQAYDKFCRWNTDFKVGIEMGSLSADNDCNVVIASVQTLGLEGSTRLAKFDPETFAGVMVDECHHAPASTYPHRRS